MYDFSYPLGNAVKSTRYQRGLTQLQVAEMADIDVRDRDEILKITRQIRKWRCCFL